ncbi:hypothetical protein JW905_04505, partial [bacterium]|nr:hypothetical protein [candidate division CSSED10-310 bacterium]
MRKIPTGCWIAGCILAALQVTECMLCTPEGACYWSQEAAGGFDNPLNYYIWSMAAMDGALICGTMNPLAGGEIYRCSESSGVETLAIGGIDDRDNAGFRCMRMFNDDLYIASMNLFNGCRLFRFDGIGFAAIDDAEFYRPEVSSIRAMTQFQNELLVATSSLEGLGAVWASSDGRRWRRLSDYGFGVSDTVSLSVMTVFQDDVMVGTWQAIGGCRLWRRRQGQWAQVNTGGFGNPDNLAAWSAALFHDRLYIGTMNWETGCEIWRSSDGATWSRVATGGFGRMENAYAWSMAVHEDRLWTGTFNTSGGFEIWSTGNGVDWRLEAPAGLGDQDNYGARAMVELDEALYVGTANPYAGAQLWRHAPFIRVPGDEPDIRQAFEAAADGEEIRVAPGTYAELVEFGG